MKATAPVIGPYSVTVAFILVVAVITYFSIIFGELIPKSFALNSPEKLALLVARPMSAIARFAAPVVWLLSAPTTAFLRVARVHANVDPPVTDEEIIGLIDAGTKAGVFHAAEQEMIESIISLEGRPISSLMTPRTEIEWIDMAGGIDEVLAKLKRGRFSRLPVASGKLDNVHGYVMAKSLLATWLDDKGIDIAAAVQKPLFVPENASMLDLLKQLRVAHSHIAFVVDEFGGVEGLITLHDISEAILGELAAEHGAENRHVALAADGSYLVDGRTPISEFQEELQIQGDPFAEVAFDTVAGLVLTELGAVPSVGERFYWRELEFEVAAMDRNRIKTIKVRRMETSPESSAHLDA
jgi:putative hemolysin